MSNPNRGSARLAELCQSGKARRAVAAVCDVTEQAVRLWTEARSIPSYRNRKVLLKHYRIALDAWDQPTERAA